VRTLGLAFLNPGSQAVLAGQLAARWTHFGLLYILETDVALKEGEVLSVW
jgi:hypothetical protein